MSRPAFRFASMADFETWVASRRQKQPPPLRLIPTEEQEQMTLIDWAWAQYKQYPELQLLAHIPNGGYRRKSEAVRFLRMGVKAGMPDLLLPIARHGAHSLFIEMKALDGTISQLQIDKAVELVEHGNCVVFAWGWEQAKDTLLWYLADHAASRYL